MFGEMLFSKYENGDSESSTTIKKHKIKEYFCKNGVFLSTTWWKNTLLRHFMFFL